VWHRTNTGVDWLQILVAYGGRMQIPETGQLVVSRRAMLRTLEFFDRLVKRRLTPRGMTSYPSETLHDSFVRGKVFVHLLGGSWHKLQWQTSNDISQEYFDENITFFPIPGGMGSGGAHKPVSISHPFACMISATASDKRLAFDIIRRSLDADLDVKHAVGSSHLVVRRSSATHEAFRADPFLQEAIRTLRFTRFGPNHPMLRQVEKILYDAIQGVEIGILTPAEGVDFVIRLVRARLGDDVVVED
jgi:inositol-phosphate transport system substrate-binding protein